MVISGPHLEGRKHHRLVRIHQVRWRLTKLEHLLQRHRRRLRGLHVRRMQLRVRVRLGSRVRLRCLHCLHRPLRRLGGRRQANVAHRTSRSDQRRDGA